MEFVIDKFHQYLYGCKFTLYKKLYVVANPDTQIDNLTKSCTACQAAKNALMVAPLYPWMLPSKPWQHINIDLEKPCQGLMCLINADVHSCWPKII